LTDVVVDIDVFSKLPSPVLEQIRVKMIQDPAPTRPKAKNKWLEMVTLDDGNRYAVTCHREEDRITITAAHVAQKWKRRIRP
jgi:hypothetical protein